MANAVGESTEKVANQLTAVWNNFYDGTQTLEHYADAMTKLGAYTASSTDEIAEGTEKFASVAKMIGLDFDTAAAALATVTAQTRQSAEVVGTAFKTIFARMQGLKLGETLEDGTDLNQYSEALAKVGINIKDQNGQLKDMTILLNEIGNRWKTLSKDQQVALAQTTAGVRQYTQFAAIFENFDMFQELVDVAKNSEGTLAEQAQIYEESWKAAAKRIKASAEEIYSAVINDQMFINLDNSLTGILHVIAQIVKAAGGLKGIISVATFATFTLLGDRIAVGFKNAATNARLLLRIEQKRARETQQTAGQLAGELQISQQASQEEKVKLDILKKNIELQTKINELSNSMTDEQLNAINNEKEKLKIMQESYLLNAQEYELNEKKIKQSSLGIRKVNLSRMESSDAATNSLNSYNNFVGENSQIQIPKFSEMEKNAIREYVNSELAPLYEKTVDISVKNQQLIDSYTRLTEEQKKSIPNLTELVQKYGQLSEVDLSNLKTQEDFDKFFKKIINEAGQAEDAMYSLYDALKYLGVPEKYLSGLLEGKRYQDQLKFGLKDLKRANEEAFNSIKASLSDVNTMSMELSQKLTGFIQKGASLAMTVQGLSTLAELDWWSGDSKTNVNNIVQAITSLSFMLPTIIPLLSKFSTALSNSFATSAINTIESSIKEQLTQLKLKIIDESANLNKLIYKQERAKDKKFAEKLKNVDIPEQTKKINELSKQYDELASSDYKVKKAEEAKAAAMGKAKLMTAGMTLAITIAIVAITSYIAWVKKQREETVKTAQEQAEKAKESTNQIKEERDNIEKLYKEYFNLNSRLRLTTDEKTQLKEKTAELCKALGVEWNILDKLNNKYDDVNKKIAETRLNNLQEEREQLQDNLEAEEYSLYTSATDGKKKDKIEYSVSGFGNVNNSGVFGVHPVYSISEQYTPEETQKIINLLKSSFGDAFKGDFKAFLNGSTGATYIKDLGQTWNSSKGTYDGIGSRIEVTQDNITQVAESVKKFEKGLLELGLDRSTLNDDNFFYKSFVTNIKKDIDEETLKSIEETKKSIEENGEALAQAMTSMAKNITNPKNIAEYRQYRAEYIEKIKEFVSPPDEKDLKEGTEEWKEWYENYADNVLSEYGDNYAEAVQNSKLFDTFKDKYRELISSSTGQSLNYNISQTITQFPEQILTAEEVKSLGGSIPLGTTVTIPAKVEISTEKIEKTEEEITEELNTYLKNIGLSEQDYSVFLKIDWDKLETDEDLENALGVAKFQYYADIASTNAQNITDALTTLRKDGYEKLSSEQKQVFSEVEERFPILARIADKSSDQYIAAIENIQEQYEQLAIGANLDKISKIKTQINVTANTDDFVEQMKNLDEAYSDLNVSIKADITSDLDNFTSKVDTVSEAFQKIGETGLVAAKDIAQVSKAFPGIMQDYTTTADGMIQLNNSVKDTAIANTKASLEEERTGISNKMALYAQYYKLLGDLYTKRAENLQNVIDNEIKEENNGNVVKGKIQEAYNTTSTELNEKEAEVRGELAKSEYTNLSLLAQDNVTSEKKHSANLTKIDNEGYQNRMKNNAEFSKAVIDNLKVVQDASEAASQGKNPLTYKGALRNTFGRSIGLSSSEYGNALEDMTYDSLVDTSKKTEQYATLLAELDAIGDKPLTAEDVERLKKEAGIDVVSFTATASMYYDMSNIANAAAAQVLATQPKGNSSGSKSSGSKSATSISEIKEAKELESLVDNYANVNEQLERYEKLLERANELTENDFKANRSKNLRAEAELYRQQEIKQGEKKLIAAQEQEKIINDIEKKTGIKIDLNYDTRRIANWKEIQEALSVNYSAEDDQEFKTLKDSYDKLVISKKLLDKVDKKSDGYETTLADYNAAAEDYNTKKEAWEKRTGQTADEYEANKELSQQLTDTTNTAVEAREAELEAYQNKRQKLVDAFLAEFEYLNDEAENRKTMNDFVKNYYESFDDVFSYGSLIAGQSAKNAQTNLDTINDIPRRYQEILKNVDMTNREKEDAIEELKQQMITNIEEFLSSIDEMQEQILAIFDETQQRFEKITSDIERRNSRIDSYKELLTLQGYDPTRSKEANKMYNQMTNTKINNLQNEYEVEKQSLDYWQQQRDEVNKKLAALNEVNDPNKQMRAQLKEQLDTIEENYQNSQDKLLDITNQTLTEIKSLYETNINKELNDLELKLTKGLGFDELQTQFDYNLEAEEQYLDMVNEEYAVKEYGRQLDKAINSAQNKYAAEQYENLRDEMEQRRANGKLSQYDLDLMNSKLEVTKAQMALEEAQNAKSTVRLVRNSAGNWDYQFTADQNKIDEAQANYDKAVNDSYNLAKNYYKTNMQNLIALRKEWYEQYKAIMTDTSLSDKERTEATNRLNERMSDKYKYTMSEMKIAQSDMSEFGKATVDDYGNVFRGVTEGIDLSYKSFEKDFTDSTNAMKKIFNEYGMVLNTTANSMSGSLNAVKSEMNNLTTATNEWKLNTTTALDEICSQERINQISDLREQIQGLYTDLYKSGAVHFTIKTDFADTQENNSQEREKDAEGNQTASDFVLNEKKARFSKIWTEDQINQAIEDYDADLMQEAIDELQEGRRTSNPEHMMNIIDRLERRNRKIDFWGLNEEKISTVTELIKHLGLATGGYTGEFSGARLAFLHEKELVLNKTDTQNILSAVAAVRELAPALLEKIGQSLNGQILAGRNLMESRMSVYKPSFSAEAQPLEQNVIIQADFPGVSAAVEIEAALNNLINDATQYASVVRG